MKQNVSAPVAVVVIVLAATVFLAILSRGSWESEPKPIRPVPDVPFLRPDDAEVSTKGLLPLGITGVMPPLASDMRRGVRVALVVPGAPGDRAGLRPGDLVLSFGGVPTPHPYALANELATAEPEQEYQIVIERAGEETTLVVTGAAALPPEEW